MANIDFLASASEIWKNIRESVESRGFLGDGLPVKCQMHEHEQVSIGVEPKVTKNFIYYFNESFGIFIMKFEKFSMQIFHYFKRLKMKKLGMYNQKQFKQFCGDLGLGKTDF